MPFVDSFISTTVTRFLIGKDKLYDKSTVVHVRWQWFVHQRLATQDECEIAKEMPSQGKDVSLCSKVVIKKLRISKRRICLLLKRRSVCA